MRLHRVLDHGEFSPSAVLWYGTDNDGNVFYYREYMKEGLLVSDHRQNIWEMSQQDGDDYRYYSQYADPSIFNLTRGRGANQKPTWSVADEWSEIHLVDRKTAIWWRPASNDEAMTISRIREYLRVDPTHRHPVTKKLGAPRAYFIKRTTDYPQGCHEVLADIRSAKRVEIGLNPDGSKQYGDERDPKVRDHLLDCVRYSIGMRPSPARSKKKDDVPEGHIRLKDYEDETKIIRARQEVERLKNWTGRGYGY